MRFGVFYELQLPKPWSRGDEARLFHEALDQVVLADRLGYDYAWEVEHHFLDEYSHSSAPEVFLAAAAARTKNIRLGHGIRQVIPNYNHPARTAEGLATLDIISNGRVDFGIGEGATRLELGGFDIPAKEKRAMALEAAEQIANMMVLDPYPGFEGKYFSMPCRNVLPKPVQKPHPPMWMACTNRDTIKVAASIGLGALAFSFVDPEEARTWAEIYYGIIKSEECVPLGPRRERQPRHGVEFLGPPATAPRRSAAARRASSSSATRSTRWSPTTPCPAAPTCGPTIWKLAATAPRRSSRRAAGDAQRLRHRHARRHAPHLAAFQEAGVDQVIFLQQAGRNRHEHICESLELFAAEVMPASSRPRSPQREARKAAELAPYIAGGARRARTG